jgi:hypothetical protein
MLTEPDNQPFSSRFFVWRRFFLACVFFVLAAFLLLTHVLPRLLKADQAIPAIEASLSERLGRTVSIQRVRWRFFPRPLLAAENVAVLERDEARAFLEVPRVELAPDLRELVQRRVVIREIRLRSPVLRLVKSPEGLSVADVAARLKSPGPGAAAWLIETVAVLDGRLILDVLAPGRRLHLDAVDLEGELPFVEGRPQRSSLKGRLADLEAPVALDLEFAPAFRWSAQGTDWPVSIFQSWWPPAGLVQGVVDVVWSQSGPAWDLDLAFGNVVHRMWPAFSLSGQMEVGPGEVRVAGVEAVGPRSRMRLSGTRRTGDFVQGQWTVEGPVLDLKDLRPFQGLSGLAGGEPGADWEHRFRASLTEVRFAPLQWKDVQWAGRVGPRRGAVENLQARAGSGQWEGRAHWAPEPSTPVVHIALSARDTPLPDLLVNPDALPLQGELTLSATAAFPLMPRGLESGRGRATVRIAQGRLAPGGLTQKILEKAASHPKVREKTGALLQDGLVFDALRADVVLRRDKITVPSLVMDGREGRLGLAGYVNPWADHMDLTVALQARAPGGGAFLFPLSLRVHGPLRAPSFRPLLWDNAKATFKNFFRTLSR